ncbi:hypothetical protein PSTG_10973 [Puccinia striiformis f. sp. tritici PST-78]|uniref:Reverse transcriptase n=2 Tax=Puccinia striiformis f. sp. tritici TaxID=168172 RepID=A0A0L0V8Z1_9BASI|nr:hypothetical protein PSTG_10973 [Puccinia striiformis f. sp. tritici PST-78]
MNEGVCVFNTITLPQCKLNPLPTPIPVETADKQNSLLEFDNCQDQPTETVAASGMASSDPKTASTDGRKPARHARMTDEGVCASSTLAPPQCKLDLSHHPYLIETAGKPLSHLESNRAVAINTAKTSWSTSAQLAAKEKANNPSRDAADIVPRRYHAYLNMFQKIGAQHLPPRRKYDFKVDLTPGALPQTSHVIPLSPAENQALDLLISEGLEHGTIRRTTSPWAAPVIFTGKKDGNLLPCFDYRKLNAVTVKNKYPLPLTMDLVGSLLDADRFTKLDLRNAYGNLRVAEGGKEKLAFICQAGQFAPLTMPFGPTGAPGYFQYLMQNILLGRIGKDVAVYLDNIMIYTQQGTDHENAVTDVLETLSKHHLWLKPEKCEFSRPEVEYLGLLISCNRIRMDPAKVKAVTDWPAPKNVTELQRFIGFSNFYRRFINHFCATTRPLHGITKANVPFNWNSRCEEAFKRLKTAFTSAPILKITDPYQAFTLECDCSDVALGAVLSQELLAIVVSFKEWRHYLEGNPNRLNAIVYTDHRNLESFMTTKQLTIQARWAETMGCFDFEIVFRPGCQSSKPDALSRRLDLAPDKEDKLTFGQLLRPENITPETFAEVAAFDTWFVDESIESEEAEKWFEIDVLGFEEPEETPEVDAQVGVSHQDNEDREAIQTDTELISLIRDATSSDKQLTEIIIRCLNPVPGSSKGMMKDYTTADGVLYSKGRIEVPADDSIKTSILKSRHDSKLAGHPSRAKTLALTRRSFTWPSQKKFVNQYVDGCDSCQRVKASAQSTLEPLPIPAGPWTDISYDLITDLPDSKGYNSILTVVDRLTKMAHFLPCHKTMSANQLADLMLREVWRHHGTPKTIVSDRGSIFISQVTKELNNRLGVKLHPSTAYHPRTDGQSEIANKEIEQYLRHFISYHQADWEGLLATAEFAYNNNDHTSTGVSPFKANYGFNPTYGCIPSSEQCLPGVEARLKQIHEVQTKRVQCLEAAQEAMKIQFDKGVSPTPKWKIGDEVWLSSKNISTTRPNAKLQHRWLGPFSIKKRISPSVYELILPLTMKGVRPTFHVSVLRRHNPDTITDRQNPDPIPVIVKGEEEWEVEEILDCRRKGRTLEYLIGWKGFGPEQNLWEPVSNLKNSQELLIKFKEEFPMAALRHKRTRRFRG